MYYTNLNSPNQTYDVDRPVLHFIKTNLLKFITGFIIVLLFMEYASYIYVYTNNTNQNLTPNLTTYKTDDFFFENKFRLLDDFQSVNTNRKINFNDESTIKDEQIFLNSSSNSSLKSKCPLIPPNLGKFFIEIIK